LEHFVERAYYNDVVAIALARKLLPDKVTHEDMPDVHVTIVNHIPRQEVNTGKSNLRDLYTEER